MPDKQNSRIEVLKQVLADVESERDRLRDARASFTALLGPLPASAAVVTGIIAAAAGGVEWGYAAGAGLVFVVLLTVSVLFGGLKPYREFRGDHQRESIGFRSGEPDLEKWLSGFSGQADLEKWLKSKVRFEEEIYGRPGERKHRRWPTLCPNSLGEALNSERAAANIVQALFVVIFAVLVIGIAIGT